MPKHKWNVNPPTTLAIPSLGPVHFVHSTRAKYLSITIKPGPTIRVTVPTKVSLPTARKFLHSKIPWVKKNLNKIKKLQQDNPQQNLPPINKTKAKTILTERLNLLAQKYRFSYNKLFIRNQKTRWGSCSSKNNISLNMNLIRLPQKIQDYVILHELVHTKHKNHSKKFWAEMDRLVGDGKKLKREMRKYRIVVQDYKEILI
jgi:predicted metal-dependent hydrolase